MPIHVIEMLIFLEKNKCQLNFYYFILIVVFMQIYIYIHAKHENSLF